MLDRDPFLTDKFFTPYHVEFEEAKLSFSLPAEDVNELPAFLNTENTDGNAFKSGVKQLIEELKKWSSQNSIQADEILDNFYRQKFVYEGGNPEYNKQVMPLYREGVPLLALIIQQLAGDKVSLNKKIDVIKELFAKLIKCAPGVHTYILDAYLNLSVQTDVFITAIKRQIAERTAMDIIVEAKKEKIEVPGDYHVHYINAMINDSSKTIGLEFVDDVIIPPNRFALDYLTKKFRETILLKLTPQEIVNQICFNIGILDLDINMDLTKFLLSNLESYGIVPVFTGINDVVDQDALADDVYRLSTIGRMLIEISIIQSLINKGYIKASFIILDVPKTYESDSSIVLNTLSFRFAFLMQNGTRIPLLPYLLSHIEEKQNDIEKFLFSQLNAEQGAHLADLLLCALADNSFILDFCKTSCLLLNIQALLNKAGRGQHFVNIFNKIPMSMHGQILDGMDDALLTKAFADINVLKAFLAVLDQNTRIAFVKRLLERGSFPVLQSIKKDLEDFAQLLPKEEMGMLATQTCIEKCFIPLITTNLIDFHHFVGIQKEYVINLFKDNSNNDAIDKIVALYTAPNSFTALLIKLNFNTDDYLFTEILSRIPADNLVDFCKNTDKKYVSASLSQFFQAELDRRHEAEKVKEKDEKSMEGVASTGLFSPKRNFDGDTDLEGNKRFRKN